MTLRDFYTIVGILLGWLLVGGVVIALLLSAWQRQAVRDRIFDNDLPDTGKADDERGGWLRRWLFLAGVRGPAAVPGFLTLTAAGAAVGGTATWLTFRSDVLDTLERLLLSIPGHVGEVFLPLAYAAPWAPLAMLGLAPTLVVRAMRRRRVMQIEQDLPIMLDLLATLAQAGLGFDLALDRILAAQPSQRPLTREFRAFQYDLLAGRPRVSALRRLGRRLEVTWFTIFISAVVQAEQIGAGLAEVLRTQAHDLRDRRRERALALAMSIPVKLLFPLIVCFLPGIMTAAIGPTFYQFFQALDSFLSPILRSP